MRLPCRQSPGAQPGRMSLPCTARCRVFLCLGPAGPHVKMEGMTIKELLRKASHRLRMADVEHADKDAELLLAHVMDKPREFLITHPDRKVGKTLEGKYEKLLDRRKAHEPIAYLLGYREFYGRTFGVDAHVLIPRPETETLIEAALETVAEGAAEGKKIAVLDVGTGSGCIALTLAAEWPDAHALGIDISEEALAVARANAERLGLMDRADFSRLDISDPVAPAPKLPMHGYLVVSANLPYLPDFTWETRPRDIREHEPVKAFVSGADGLNHYRALLRRLSDWDLMPDLLLLEADPPQFAPLANLVRGAFRDHLIRIRKDLRGLDRILVARRRT